jgi:hypothetical protein
MNSETTRRDFLSVAGKGLGLAALAIPTIGSHIKEVEAASRSSRTFHQSRLPSMKTYWAVIQNSFTVTRGIHQSE